MSRLKIDFETEDTAVVCELADMLRRLHGKERHTCCQPPPAFTPPPPINFVDGGSMGVIALDTPPPPFAAQLPDPQEVETGLDVIPYTPPPAGSASDLDADGIPWDGRIHSSSKAKLAKTGQWKLARGCDPALAEKVTAELKAVMALPAASQIATPLVTAPPPPYLPEQPAVAPPVPPTVEPPPATTAVLPPPPVAPVAPPSGAPTTFPAFLVAVTQQQAAKRITFDEVLAVLKEHGLENIQLLTARPDLIPAIYARLEGIWTSR